VIDFDASLDWLAKHKPHLSGTGAILLGWLFKDGREASMWKLLTGWFSESEKKMVGKAIDELMLMKPWLAKEIDAEKSKIVSMNSEQIAAYVVGKAQVYLKSKFGIGVPAGIMTTEVK
jgi:hypothetical protein